MRFTAGFIIARSLVTLSLNDENTRLRLPTVATNNIQPMLSVGSSNAICDSQPVTCSSFSWSPFSSNLCTDHVYTYLIDYRWVHCNAEWIDIRRPRPRRNTTAYVAAAAAAVLNIAFYRTLSQVSAYVSRCCITTYCPTGRSTGAGCHWNRKPWNVYRCPGLRRW